MSVVYVLNPEGALHVAGEWEEVRTCIYVEGLLHKGFNAYSKHDTQSYSRGKRKEWFILRVDPESNAHFWKIVYEDAPVVVLLANLIAEDQ